MSLLKELGIRGRAARILDVIEATGPLSAAELKAKTGIAPKQLREALRWLQDRSGIFAAPRKAFRQRRLSRIPGADVKGDRYFTRHRGSLSFAGDLVAIKIDGRTGRPVLGRMAADDGSPR